MSDDIANSVRIIKDKPWAEGRVIVFALAIGSVRQVCHLQTNCRTQHQALSYLHKHRARLERIARERFARGEVTDGVIHLTMI